ncbi:MAG: hypothetical protein M3364_04505 [Actinomycetota bacterium]|nr:hypothetical protein [Actinomycetota bacterium]
MSVLNVFNWQGVAVAPASTILTVSPSWTRLDTLAGARVEEVQIRRGKSDEFEITGTGTCRVGFNDRTGAVDPTTIDWISRPFAFVVRNPVTGVWHPRFRGAVDDHHYNLDPSEIKGDVVIEAVDALDFFANVELAPGLFGDPPPEESAGYVFFEDTTVTGPKIRIEQGLGNIGWPVGLQSIFTGNVNLLQTVYSPGESLLTVFHDAAEAEFPTVANFYIDKHGVVCFHGRLARFTPASVASSATHWDFNTFTAGAGGVQMRPPYEPSRSRRFIRNAALCYPQKIIVGSNEIPFPVADRPGQVVLNTTSIATHQRRSWSAENLLVKSGITSGLSGKDECKTYANYIVRNYHTPHPRIEQITFKALRPDDARGPALWNLLCKVDISDQFTITKPHPGGGGLSAVVYFVEGITETWRPLVRDLDTGYPYCEMTLDLSPAAYWTTQPSLP